MSEQLDPQWHTISRFMPENVDIETLLQMQSIVPKVIVADHVYDAAVDLARTSRPEEGKLPTEMRSSR